MSLAPSDLVLPVHGDYGDRPEWTPDSLVFPSWLAERRIGMAQRFLWALVFMLQGGAEEPAEVSASAARDLIGMERGRFMRCLVELERKGMLVVHRRRGRASLLTVVFDPPDNGYRPTPIVRSAILERDGWRCRYCGEDLRQVPGEVDHVVPRSAGGLDDDSNLAASCRPCNLAKRDTPLAEWAGR